MSCEVELVRNALDPIFDLLVDLLQLLDVLIGGFPVTAPVHFQQRAHDAAEAVGVELHQPLAHLRVVDEGFVGFFVDEVVNGAAGGAPAPDTMAGALMAEQGGVPGAPNDAPGGFPGMGMPGGGIPAGPEGAMAQMSDRQPLAYKDDSAERDIAVVRWEEILDRSLERVLERQQRVVLEKVGGKKSREFLSSGSLDSESILNNDTWTKQMDEDIRPVLSAIVKDSKSIYAEKSANYSGPSASDIHAHLDAQMTRIKSINDDTRTLLDMAIFNSFGIKNDEERLSALKTSIVSIYTDLLVKIRPEVASAEARRSWDYCRP